MRNIKIVAISTLFLSLMSCGELHHDDPLRTNGYLENTHSLAKSNKSLAILKGYAENYDLLKSYNLNLKRGIEKIEAVPGRGEISFTATGECETDPTPLLGPKDKKCREGEIIQAFPVPGAYIVTSSIVSSLEGYRGRDPKCEVEFGNYYTTADGVVVPTMVIIWGSITSLKKGDSTGHITCKMSGIIREE